MKNTELICRENLLATSQKLCDIGLNKGTSGNASVRCGNGFLVTPSGLDVSEMSPACMVAMHFDGSFDPKISESKIADSQIADPKNLQPDTESPIIKPSSEWRFHRDILRSRPEINAVIHTHSMFATTVSCLRREVPPFHYMIAIAGGDTIRCAPYALFGSQELSDNALIALLGRKACLLANHGMIALGTSLEDALAVTVEVENLCEQFWRILQVREPYLLTEDEMFDVFMQFKGYGKWSQPM
jgi:L-fuculose-phosphate aldolase